MSFTSATVNGVPITLSPANVAPEAFATGTSTFSAATPSAHLHVDAVWTDEVTG
jgi:hypothetical protein